MNHPRPLLLERSDLDHAAQAGLLPAACAEPLWHWLLQRAAARQLASPASPRTAPAAPRFDFTHILYYLGGCLAIGAASLFLNEAWERLGGAGLAATGSVYGLLCLLLARRLDARGLEVPASIVATLAVCLVPLVTWSLQHALGLWPSGGPEHYRFYFGVVDWRWLTLELVTLVAAALSLWRLRHPFLMVPLVFTLWFLGQDLARLLVDGHDAAGWAFYRDFTMAFGACIALLALWVDARSRGPGGSRRDYAFWAYLVGVVGFWTMLSAHESAREFDKFVYGMLNLGLIGCAALLGRRVFAVCGGLGLAFYLGHLSHRVFHDSLLFPLALTLIGFAVMAAGVWWQRNESRMQVALRRRLPRALHAWLPDEPG